MHQGRPVTTLDTFLFGECFAFPCFVSGELRWWRSETRPSGLPDHRRCFVTWLLRVQAPGRSHTPRF
eukprot:6205664-Pleurochrysis_carterae.AAC.5